MAVFKNICIHVNGSWVSQKSNQHRHITQISTNQSEWFYWISFYKRITALIKTKTNLSFWLLVISESCDFVFDSQRLMWKLVFRSCFLKCWYLFTPYIYIFLIIYIFHNWTFGMFFFFSPLKHIINFYFNQLKHSHAPSKNTSVFMCQRIKRFSI